MLASRLSGDRKTQSVATVIQFFYSTNNTFRDKLRVGESPGDLGKCKENNNSMASTYTPGKKTIRKMAIWKSW